MTQSHEKKPTFYVITYYEFNHAPSSSRKTYPLDPRFLESDKNYVYYLIDKTIPPPLQQKKTILEYDIDLELHKAGGRYLAEWSFLLAEEKHSFCDYPLFMISSRFYQKNQWLRRNLDDEWDTLFDSLEQYGYGYLPSYDRPIRWIDLSWEKYIKNPNPNVFFPFTEKTYQITEEILNVNIPKDYRYTADLFCNYIGFRSREELLAYVHYYKPLIHYFFDEKLQLKTPLEPYVKMTHNFVNEKPFTFILELLSHLFFFQKEKPYFALHYDGYYQINEAHLVMKKLKKIPAPFRQTRKEMRRWRAKQKKTEGPHALKKDLLIKAKTRLLCILKWGQRLLLKVKH